MARGFFTGVIAGTLVSVLGLGALSVISGPGPQGVPSRGAPQAGGVDVPEGSGFSQPRDDTVAALPAPGDSPDPGTAPEVSTPEKDDLAALRDGDTETAAQPQADTAEAALSEPAAGDGSAGVSVDSEAPVLPSPQAAEPETPVAEEDISLSTDPAQPVLPDVSGDSAAFPSAEVADAQTAPDTAASETGAAPAAEADEDQTAEAEPASPEMQPEAEAETAGAAADPATDPAVTEPEADTQSAAAEVEVPETPKVFEAPEPVGINADPAAPATADPEPEAPALEAQTAEAESAPEPASAEPAESDAAESSSVIGDLAPEVTTNRLPSVGDPATEAAAAPEPEPEAAAMVDEADLPALKRHAVAFDAGSDKPLMSIILIDDGSSPIGLEALASFPYPLNFAIPANRDGATEEMKRYREAGFEVLAIVNLPEGSSAQDAEVTFQASFAALPETVAIMEGEAAGLQTSRAASDQLAPILLDSGHGAVLYPQGLNTAQKMLDREGVPAVTVFRDFDASGQSATVIRRFLDQAAFKAGQEEAGVVMVGRLRPDTVSALLLWGLQDRASRVTLAPISAILTGGGS